jgi:hypothetical protein
MDDFLYNLRRDTDKRNRRQGGQQNYRGPDRRGPKDQRRGYHRRNEAMDQLTELLPEIKSLLETVGENQKQLIADEKRKTMVLENIAASLRMMSGNTQPPEAPDEEFEPVEAAAADAPEATISKTAVDVDTDKTSFDPAVEAATDETSIETTDTDTSEEAPKRSKREDVRKIALELRDKGMTYKQIAQYLDDEKIPTFSGKGGWHAPTIHKLCK